MIDILLISVGLAMDAFAVSICKGLSFRKINLKKSAIVGLYFGLFQALMPLIGYLFASMFKELIESVDHWIAFILLLSIGIKMIIESFDKDNNIDDNVNFKSMILLAIATSIDALAVGITLSFLNINIFIAILMIGIVTFVLSFLGALFGSKISNKLNVNFEIIGGIILITIGVKILLEHLDII